MDFKKFQPFDAGAQTTLVKLLQSNQIQAADLFTPDPTIATNQFLVLQDPLHVFSSQNLTPLVCTSAVNDTGMAVLNAVPAKLTTADLLDRMQKAGLA